MKQKNTVFSLFIIVFVILLILDPKNNINACLDGIKLWSTAILPSLLPFFFFTSLLSNLGVVQKLGQVLTPITQRVFKTDGISGYIYAMSVISGYPVGAKITAELYENGSLRREQACKISTFTSTSGPLFIIGSVGVGMFHSATLGYLILLCHIIGAFLNGIIYRNIFNTSYIGKTLNNFEKPKTDDHMYNSIKSVLVIGGYVAIFYVIITMINNYNILYPFAKFISLIFNCRVSTANTLLGGLIEVTRGCSDLAKLGITSKQALVLCTGLISFGGISIITQAYTFLNKFKMPLKFYICSKITQTILSVIVALIVGNIFL